MFRSSIRDPRSTSVTGTNSATTAVRLPPDQQMLLRAAIAAANAVAMRSSSPSALNSSSDPNSSPLPYMQPIVLK